MSVTERYANFPVWVSSNTEEAQELFSDLCCDRSTTVHDIRFMIDAGINPRYNNDQAFRASCGRNINVFKYFIEEYGVDINFKEISPIKNAMTSGNPEFFRILLEKSIDIPDCAIEWMIEWKCHNEINMMLEYGQDPTRVARALWCILQKKCNGIDNIMDILNKYGIDLNTVR